MLFVELELPGLEILLMGVTGRGGGGGGIRSGLRVSSLAPGNDDRTGEALLTCLNTGMARVERVDIPLKDADLVGAAR